MSIKQADNTMGRLYKMIQFLDQASGDGRVGPAHISLYVSILKCWLEQDYPRNINASRTELMSYAKILSMTTYHRCMRQLEEFGYIHYYCTVSKWNQSSIILKNTLLIQ